MVAGGTTRPFQLVAGNAALDLVNTLDSRFAESGPVELLSGYDELLRFTAEAGLISAPVYRQLRRTRQEEDLRMQVLNQVKELRESLAVVAYGMVHAEPLPGSDVALLERYFKQAAAARALTESPEGLRWTWRDPSELSAPLFLLAHEAEELLLSGKTATLRFCDAPTCRWLFLDTSKNHTRRWYDMKICGNRMKARRFQSRRA